MKKYKTIQITNHSGVATIWLNRPAVHNAINPDMINELSDVFPALQKNGKILIIGIRGHGKSFSSGADLNAMKDMGAGSWDSNLNDAKSLAEVLFTIYSCIKPVISILHGNVTGGAIGIAAASDIVVADSETSFRFSEVRLGLVPATIAPYVLRKIGYSAAKNLMITSRWFSATEAREMELVNYLFEKGDLEESLRKLYDDILVSSPEAIKETRKMLSEIASKNIDEKMISFTAGKLASARSSEDGKEGVTAFLEKRPPVWSEIRSNSKESLE